MNKALSIIFLFITIASFQSCRNCNTYVHTAPIILDCVFKAGSYFVYNDSTDHIIDSEYVYQYTYQINGVELSRTDGCFTYGGDIISMSQNSFHDGIFFDKIYSNNESQPVYLFIGDSLGYDHPLSEAPTFMPYNNSSVLSNFSVSGNIYPTVYKDSSAYSTIVGSDTVPTDLYFAPNYGIVKRVEHRPTGDVSWDLIRYHIVH